MLSVLLPRSSAEKQVRRDFDAVSDEMSTELVLVILFYMVNVLMLYMLEVFFISAVCKEV